MKKKTTLIYILVLLCILFITDRYLWMPERAKHVWRWESGIGLGDPISYEYDFEIKGSEIIVKKFIKIDGFKNTNRIKDKSYYLAGCYFGKLYIYDSVKGIMTIYDDE